MCNLYSMTSNAEAIRALAKAMKSSVGNLPIYEFVGANGFGPLVRNTPGGRELALSRWGMPTPAKFLIGKNYDAGVTNVRTTASPHWRRWLGVENRCLVPFTSFSEPDQASGSKILHWFGANAERPLMFFAGIWTPAFTSVRKVAEGPTTNDLYGFLTTDANAEVKAIHPKAMPVILRFEEERELWMTGTWEEVQHLQRPLPDRSLTVVATGRRKDGTHLDGMA
ncbi:SOS response-associated peptidase [Asticcacaulis machinosus]|uniref:Abasic site processing protein n=1 Tax=Asticcacaulis machinosus TaxID=2984211 RepID=A0ABT5HG94_9CAUL|nr:SOS response-associated peptidase [Asticcacaulis machinosus]MDC7675207.1 SOS response-associated peptidase [Asticcacaulis machinosus]